MKGPTYEVLDKVRIFLDHIPTTGTVRRIQIGGPPLNQHWKYLVCVDEVSYWLNERNVHHIPAVSI